MRALPVFALALLAASAHAADNVVLNSDFGVASGTLSNWDLIQYIGADPTDGHIGVTSEYWTSSRFSASISEYQGQASIRSTTLRQDFGPVTGVEEISVNVMSVDQRFLVYLRYTDGTADLFSRQVFSASPVLDNAVDWNHWDLTADLDLNKTLKGIDVRVDMGDLNSGYAAYIEDVVVRATPVPEPATLAALGLGLAFLRRRKA